MILRENEHEYIITSQHDHAYLSGEFAKHFSRSVLSSEMYRQDFLLAVTQHDRSWIRLDETLIWNDRTKAPYSFLDYPLHPKLTSYQYGLNEIEKLNKYACLLSSMHYSSFFTESTQEDCLEFLRQEIARQNRIKQELRIEGQELVQLHFRLLQFCDDLSLYMCLNEPGVRKENEYARLRNGIPRTEFLADDGRLLVAKFMNQDEVILEPFPFENEFSAAFRQKRVSKQLVAQVGISESYKQTEYVEQTASFKRWQ